MGVVADTHWPRYDLPRDLIQNLHGVDLILHAGGICRSRALRDLEAIAPVEAIYGNQGDEELAERLPARLDLTPDTFRVTVIHGHQGRTALTAATRIAEASLEADCIVFGHSHHAYQGNAGKVILFNPGSPAWKRGSRFRSFGLLRTSDVIETEICTLGDGG